MTDFFDEYYDGPVELWRHKPIVKQVIQYTGDNDRDIVAWGDGKAYIEVPGRLVIRTPQGELVPTVGDYIVRGVEDELYPVPRGIFVASYERVGERS